jgi:hypothetical protein
MHANLPLFAAQKWRAQQDGAERIVNFMLTPFRSRGSKHMLPVS